MPISQNILFWVIYWLGTKGKL